MNELNLWKFILKSIEEKHPVVLLCVVDSHGSSPGRRGFKMAVAADGLHGSIGGGIMEHKFAEMAKERLRSKESETVIRRQIHNKVAKKNQSGMICSGEQSILLYNIEEEHESTLKSIIGALEKNGNGWLYISNDEFKFTAEGSGPEVIFEMKSDDEWSFLEWLGYKNHLYIVGGGHCSLAFSRLMRSLDFYVHVFDEREKLNTFEQNTFAHEKKIIPDYEELNKLIPSGENIYIVIMTFGYRTDDVALRAVINGKYKYLGVLGSKSKMEKMFEEWKRDGLPADRLNNIFAPVGISINSQSPEEIAVSIAAEIISVKNGKMKSTA